LKDEVDTYIKKNTWLVKENANAGYSISGLQLMLADNAIKDYLLNGEYKGKIAKAYKDGYFHIHDLGMGITCYCMGHDLKELLDEGFNGVNDKVSAAPPKHLRSAVSQMVNYLFCNQAENAGAQAFNNVDTLLAPYIKYENLSYKEVKQSIQEFIYNMNVANRVGFQAPFSNVTFDLKCPKHFKKIIPKIGGESVDFTYNDCNDEIGMITKAFFEVMMEGDNDGRPFTFPIPTVNIHEDFVWDDDVAKVIFESTAKFGTANFQNFLNSDLDPEDTFSMCCRLRLNKRELVKNSGGLFGSSAKTGSIGVVTINLPRLAYESKDKEEFYEKLETYMEIAKDSLEIKRNIINENLENNLMPYTKRYIGTYKNHFSTIGILGGNETCLNLLNTTLETKEGHEFICEVLDFMKSKVEDFQEETGNYYNLEQSPAEGASYKLALKDKELYNDIKTSGTEDSPFYTNSTHVPVNNKLSLIKMLQSQDELNKYYNGGTIVHVYLGEKVSDWINCMLMVKKIAEKTTLSFFDLVPIFSICPIHGYISGEHETCPLEHTEKDLDKFGLYIKEEK